MEWEGVSDYFISAKPQNATMFAAALLEYIRNIVIELPNGSISITASAGIRAVEQDELMYGKFDDVLVQADMMLYATKHIGRDQFVLYKK